MLSPSKRKFIIDYIEKKRETEKGSVVGLVLICGSDIYSRVEDLIIVDGGVIIKAINVLENKVGNEAAIALDDISAILFYNEEEFQSLHQRVRK